MSRFRIVVEKADGRFSAYSPDLPGAEYVAVLT